MKKTAVALALALGLLGPGVDAETTALAPKGPKIEVRQDRHDFGKIAQGIEAIHVFDIRNAGDELLEIQKVETS